ncbi:19445_t:CDS:2, partial [Funneliformis geosporum]
MQSSYLEEIVHFKGVIKRSLKRLVTITKQETFELMKRDAVRLAKLVSYISVEYPMTEIVSDVNLPAQLQIATGIPFHQICNIRVDNVDIIFL